jgi:hypothetical protein
VNQKGLTYLFLLVFLLTTGTAFSKSVYNMKHPCFPGKPVQKAAFIDRENPSALGQSGITNVFKNLENNQPAHIDKLSIYLIKNYILSNYSISFVENTRRTSIWFTSRIKN